MGRAHALDRAATRTCATNGRRRSRRHGLSLFALAFAGFACVAVLGRSLARPFVTRLDLAAVRFRGRGVPAAVVFTRLGYWPALTVLSLAAVAAASLLGARAWHVVAIVVASHALSQAAVAGVKLLFRRTRPDYWLVVKEADTSFPSGHSSTAMTFYLGLAILTWHLPLAHEAAAAACAILGVAAAGVPWSRLSLGAHFATDVIGGVLFGGSWLALTFALASRFGLA